jgi:uncharacterized OB-fold protein
MSMSNEWIEASGKARVYSWTIFHQLYYPSFADQIPYNVAIVELEEGPRMHSNVVDCKNEDIHIDMPLELIWEQIDDSDWYLPKYKPATGG